MRSFLIIALTPVLLTMSSFSEVESEEVTGSYGVCDCNSASLKLELHKEGTFSYSDPDHSIEINGKWIRKKGAIQLSEYNSDCKIPNRWNVKKKGTALISRKGLAFYRLVNLDHCH